MSIHRAPFLYLSLPALWPIRMDRIKSRQQKFKRGKERMLSLVQEAGEGQAGVKEEEEEEEEGMGKHCSRQ